MADQDGDPVQPWPVRVLIEQTVADWLASWSPLPLPSLIEDAMLGELDRLITRRLVAAGLIDDAACDDQCGIIA